MSAAPELAAVRALVNDPDPKVGALARALVSLARPEALPTSLGIAGVAARYGVNSSTIDRRVKARIFPAPTYFGTRRLWKVPDLDAWDAAQRATPHVSKVRGIAAVKKAAAAKRRAP